MNHPQAAPSRAGSALKALFCLGLALLLGLFALLMLSAGFSSLRDIRRLERAPRSLVAAVLPGEATLSGRASADGAALRAPDSGAEALYYRYLVEREERDEDGDKHWKTIADRTAFQAFVLSDESGSIRIDPSERVRFDADVRHTRRDGDLRYSEARIDPGDEVFVFGYVDAAQRPPRIEFETAGQYSPLVSIHGEASAHSGMTGTTLLLLWIGLGALGLAVFALLWVLRVHVSTTYLAGLSIAMAAVLLSLSLRSAREDLAESFARTARDVAAAQSEIDAHLRERGIEWNRDWGSLAEPAMPGHDRLDADALRLLAHLRARLALQVERTLAVRRRWPERWLAASTALPELPSIPPPAAAPLQMEPPTDAGSALMAYLVATLAFAMATLFAWLGLRSVKLKRTIENLAATRTAGVAYGLVELNARAEPEAGSPALIGPLSQRPCVWYHYVVEERRGSGKNEKWVKIEERRAERPFCLVDDEGSLPIDLRGAEAIVSRRRSRREGRQRYSERWIEPGTPLYVLGSAGIDPRSGDTLMLCRGPGDQPFLVTDLPESELMLRKARGGFLLLNFATQFGIATTFCLLGANVALDGAGFLLATLAPLSLFALFLAAAMYNDLVTLRQRVRLAWANIEVSLLKRAELVPRLEAVLQAYLGHEAALQAGLSRLRDLSRQASLGPQAAGRLVGVEQEVIAHTTALYERHPELKADELAMQLSSTLVRLDNEVALMREGYNNAVERYETRRRRLPDLVFAKIFRFEPVAPFQAE
jgi:hypothetical protein